MVEKGLKKYIYKSPKIIKYLRGLQCTCFNPALSAEQFHCRRTDQQPAEQVTGSRGPAGGSGGSHRWRPERLPFVSTGATAVLSAPATGLPGQLCLSFSPRGKRAWTRERRKLQMTRIVFIKSLFIRLYIQNHTGISLPIATARRASNRQ